MHKQYEVWDPSMDEASIPALQQADPTWLGNRPAVNLDYDIACDNAR